MVLCERGHRCYFTREIEEALDEDVHFIFSYPVSDSEPLYWKKQGHVRMCGCPSMLVRPRPVTKSHTSTIKKMKLISTNLQQNKQKKQQSRQPRTFSATKDRRRRRS